MGLSDVDQVKVTVDLVSNILPSAIRQVLTFDLERSNSVYSHNDEESIRNDFYPQKLERKKSLFKKLKCKNTLQRVP